MKRFLGTIRRLLAGLVTAVFAVALLIAVLEIAFRIGGQQKCFSLTVNTWDREVGTKLIPGERGFLICPGTSVDMVVNSKGLRDAEYTYAKPVGTRRILCLGDSFTFGHRANIEDVYTEVLERRLQAEMGETRWQVLNAGIGSTGTANQLVLFETEGYKYEPDIVVLGFCPANDYQDNVISGLYSLSGDELVKHDAPRTNARRLQPLVHCIPFYRTFFAKSYFLQFVKRRLTLLHYKNLEREFEHRTSDPVSMDRLELTQRLVLELNRRCLDTGARFVLMVVQTPNLAELPEWTESLEQVAHEAEIPCLDLAPYFPERDHPRLYIPKDGHWTPEGHRVVAEALQNFLAENGFLDEPSIASDGTD